MVLSHLTLMLYQEGQVYRVDEALDGLQGFITMLELNTAGFLDCSSLSCIRHNMIS